ncbi:MAG: hypothetical protein HGA45_04890 [Chloroflexales bacterium]|nr:hypothetical protein [Chloroflexales bacterium]
MKPKRPRGMRELTTIQGLSGRTVPSSREQIVAEQSRLEHERARLERELLMWQENERRTNERLNAALERLAMLTAACAQSEGAPEARPAQRPAQRLADESEPATEWHEIVLEY